MRSHLAPGRRGPLRSAVRDGGTPDEQGFLPTVIAEAEVAVRHAQLVARDLQDLGGMKTHSWQEGEGGLNQAMQHMGFLLRGEGLDGSSS